MLASTPCHKLTLGFLFCQRLWPAAPRPIAIVAGSQHIPRQSATVQGSSEGSELTLYGEMQAVRCREALSHMQIDRYSQLGCVNLTALLAGFQASKCLSYVSFCMSRAASCGDKQVLFFTLKKGLCFSKVPLWLRQGPDHSCICIHLRCPCTHAVSMLHQSSYVYACAFGQLGCSHLAPIFRQNAISREMPAIYPAMYWIDPAVVSAAPSGGHAQPVKSSGKGRAEMAPAYF